MAARERKFAEEVKNHLTQDLIPFWEGMADRENGGYYGYMGYGLEVDKEYEKGCILNSRILWFFSNAYLMLGEGRLLEDAGHAYRFLKERCMDRQYGGVYWSVAYDGSLKDDAKHTYSQAFAIYALSSYYDASGDGEALALARELQLLVEEKCKDAQGYLEAFNRQFEPEENEKLSENGVMAERTMNTLLHVLEAYTELYRVSPDERTGKALRSLLDTFADKVYNRRLGRQEVFFDKDWNMLIDLYSYGHDIETSWLVDRALCVLQDAAYKERLLPITTELARNIYDRAYVGHSVLNEAECGVADATRVWWVQAEAVVGFLNAWQKLPEEMEWLFGAEDIWEFIKGHLIDRRDGSEWYWAVDAQGKPLEKPIVEPWKCPYHNGRMCMEVMRRMDCDT